MPILASPRHERFAQELAKGKSSKQAYVDAGYKDSKAAESSSSDLLRNPKIAARVAELQALAAKQAEVTIESLIRELKDS